MTMSTATARPGWPRSKMYRSGSQSTSVTSTASREKSQRGAELIRVTTGQARQAITTPTIVSLA